jgi:hypothetical protein
MGECAPFATGFAWGSVRAADVKIAGEHAGAIPHSARQRSDHRVRHAADLVQQHGREFRGARRRREGHPRGGPSCSGLRQRVHCQPAGRVLRLLRLGLCASTAPLASQVVNPVAAFAEDNNGVAIVLPDVPPGGAASLTGSLIFGIGTKANNQPGSVASSPSIAREFHDHIQGRDPHGLHRQRIERALLHRSVVAQVFRRLLLPPSTLNLSAVVASPNGSSKT